METLAATLGSWIDPQVAMDLALDHGLSLTHPPPPPRIVSRAAESA
jgi:hypothetical protein